MYSHSCGDYKSKIKVSGKNFLVGGISGQDGSVGRHTVPPHTTKRRTTNLKTKNNQNCQNIELYGSQTTKELKKKHSFRPLGGAEMGSRSKRTLSEVAARGDR